MTLVGKKADAKKALPKKSRSAAKAEPARELVSPQAFGDAIGVSRQAVERAIRDGRLMASVVRETRGRLTYTRIDLEGGKAEWATNTAPRKETGRPTLELELDPAALPARRPGMGGDNDDEDEFGEGNPGDIILGVERARKEKYLADKHALDVAIKSRQLVARAQVLRDLFAVGRVVRDGLAAAAIELPGQLARMKSKKEIEILLEQHAAKVAASLDREVEKLAKALEEGTA